MGLARRRRLLREGRGQLGGVLFRRLPLLQRGLDPRLRVGGNHQGPHDAHTRLLQHLVSLGEGISVIVLRKLHAVYH